jgi:hypothetical protein
VLDIQDHVIGDFIEKDESLDWVLFKIPILDHGFVSPPTVTMEICPLVLLRVPVRVLPKTRTPNILLEHVSRLKFHKFDVGISCSTPTPFKDSLEVQLFATKAVPFWGKYAVNGRVSGVCSEHASTPITIQVFPADISRQ